MTEIIHSTAKEHLKAFVARIERLEEEKAEHERLEEEALLATYMHALGMLPLFDDAQKAVFEHAEAA